MNIKIKLHWCRLKSFRSLNFLHDVTTLTAHIDHLRTTLLSIIRTRHFPRCTKWPFQHCKLFIRGGCIMKSFPPARRRYITGQTPILSPPCSEELSLRLTKKLFLIFLYLCKLNFCCFQMSRETREAPSVLPSSVTAAVISAVTHFILHESLIPLLVAGETENQCCGSWTSEGKNVTSDSYITIYKDPDVAQTFSDVVLERLISRTQKMNWNSECAQRFMLHTSCNCVEDCVSVSSPVSAAAAYSLNLHN